MKQAALLLAVVASLCPLLCHAEQSEPSHLLVTLDQVDVRFHANGSSDVERTEIVKALDDTGAHMLSTLTVPFNQARQNVRVVGASVVMPDESMRSIGADGVTTTAWPGTDTTPAFQNARRTEVHFGKLVAGSVVSAHYIVSSNQPWLPGLPAYFAINPRNAPLEDVSYKIEAPRSLRLQVVANGMVGGHQVTGDLDSWSFQVGKLPPLVNIASSSEMLGKSPYVMATTDVRGDASADAYMRRIRPAENVTLELQQLADSISKDSINPRTLMSRYYAWINTHLRLVDVPLGLTEASPRSAQDILWSGYSSPEDRVILLQALMRAKEVPSDVVFVPTLPVSWPNMPSAIPAFADRLLLSVDAGQLPLDIANPVLAMGEFDTNDRGKFGLRVSGNGQASPMQVPAGQSAGASTVASTVTVQLAGSLEGVSTMASYGDLATVARDVVYTRDPTALRNIIARRAPMSTLLAITRQDDPLQPAHSFTLQGKYTLPGYHPLNGAYRMPVPRVMTGISALDDFATPQGGVCQRTIREEDTTIHWASPVTVEVPGGTQHSVGDGLGRYSATYVYDASRQTLHVLRKLELSVDPVACDKHQQNLLTELADVVRNDLDGQLTVTQLVPVKVRKK